MSPCDRFVWVKLDVAFKSMHVCIQECKDPVKREFHDIPEGMVRMVDYLRHNGASKLVLFEMKAFNIPIVHFTGKCLPSTRVKTRDINLIQLVCFC